MPSTVWIAKDQPDANQIALIAILAALHDRYGRNNDYWAAVDRGLIVTRDDD